MNSCEYLVLSPLNVHVIAMTSHVPYHITMKSQCVISLQS